MGFANTVDEVFSNLLDANILEDNVEVLLYFFWTGPCLVLRHSSYSIEIALLKKSSTHVSVLDLMVNYPLACVVKQCVEEYKPNS